MSDKRIIMPPPFAPVYEGMEKKGGQNNPVPQTVQPPPPKGSGGNAPVASNKEPKKSEIKG